MSWSSTHAADAVPFYSVSWSWDDTAFSGSNTGDACALIDCDHDSLANYAVCVTVGTTSGKTGINMMRLFECKDTHAFRCFYEGGGGGRLIGESLDGVTWPSTTPLASKCLASTSPADPFKGNVNPDTQVLCDLDFRDLGLVKTPPQSCTLTNVCSFPSASANSDDKDCVGYKDKAFGYVYVEVLIEGVSDTQLGLVEYDVMLNGTKIPANLVVNNTWGVSDAVLIDPGFYTLSLVAKSGAVYSIVSVTVDNGTPMDGSDDTSSLTFYVGLFNYVGVKIVLSCDQQCQDTQTSHPPILESWPFYAIATDAAKSLADELDLVDVLPPGYDFGAQGAQELIDLSSVVDANAFVLRDSKTGALLGGIVAAVGPRVVEHSLSVCARFLGGSLESLGRVPIANSEYWVTQGTLRLPAPAVGSIRVNHIALAYTRSGKAVINSAWTTAGYDDGKLVPAECASQPNDCAVIVAQVWTPLSQSQLQAELTAALLDHWIMAIGFDSVNATAVTLPTIAVPRTSLTLEQALNGTDAPVTIDAYTEMPASREIAEVFITTIDTVFPSTVVVGLASARAANVSVGVLCWRHDGTTLEQNLPIAAGSWASADVLGAPAGYSALLVLDVAQCADVVVRAAAGPSFTDSAYTNLGYTYVFGGASTTRSLDSSLLGHFDRLGSSENPSSVTTTFSYRVIPGDSADAIVGDSAEYGAVHEVCSLRGLVLTVPGANGGVAASLFARDADALATAGVYDTVAVVVQNVLPAEVQVYVTVETAAGTVAQSSTAAVPGARVGSPCVVTLVVDLDDEPLVHTIAIHVVGSNDDAQQQTPTDAELEIVRVALLSYDKAELDALRVGNAECTTGYTLADVDAGAPVLPLSTALLLMAALA